jgi:hypothetical protein
MNARYGPRIGPRIAAGGTVLWLRRIEGRNLLFLASTTDLVIYDDDQHHLIRHTTKDPS